MSDPTTPKKTGVEINRLARSLNSLWDLHLPIKEGAERPAKVPNRGAMEEQIYQKIRQLYFRDSETLNRALDSFSEKAKHVQSNWVFKPHADRDVLPQRAPGESLLQQRLSDIPLERHTELRRCLLQLLFETLDTVTVTVTPLAKGMASYAMSNVPILSMPSHLDVPALGQPIKLAQEDAPMPMDLETARPASSSDYPLSSGQREAFEGFRESQSLTASTNARTRERLGQASHPKEESTLERCPTVEGPMDLFQTDTLLLQQSDLVRIPNIAATTRKRSSSGTILHQERSKDLSKGFSEHAFNDASNDTLNHTSMVHHVNHLVPREFDGNLPRKAETSFSTTTTETSTLSHDTPLTSFTSDGSSFTALKRHRSYATTAELNRETFNSMQLDSEIGDLEMGTSEKHVYAPNRVPNTREPHQMSDILTRSMMEPAKPKHYLPYGPRSTSFAHTSTISGKDAAIKRNKTRQSLQNFLLTCDPFANLLPLPTATLPFRYTYEISRIVTSWNLPDLNLGVSFSHLPEDYDDFWLWMESIAARNEQKMPARSDPTAWAKAKTGFNGVNLGATLNFSEQQLRGPLLTLRLSPMGQEPSYRFARKFGHDRFLTLGIPSFARFPRRLPDTVFARQEVLRWLLENDHVLLGRRWRAWFCKPQSRVFRSENPSNPIEYRLFLFAIDGDDFGRSSDHVPVSIKELLEWFMQADLNQEAPLLKLFSRLALGFTSTTPTLTFAPFQIVATHDAYAGLPGERRLAVDGLHAPRPPGWDPSTSVMNDGCARISRAAATRVANVLGLMSTPSAFQGRIGGAKGLWIVDAIGEVHHGDDIWIEITESQQKFRPHEIDKISPDPSRVTFDVQSFARPLAPGTLNFQLIPLLVSGKVRKEVLENLHRKNLTRKVDEIEEALKNHLVLKRWLESNYPNSINRLCHREIEVAGAIPDAIVEQIHWFLDSGFQPYQTHFLMDRCRRLIKAYCDRLETRCKLDVDRCTTALMIPDPLGVLEEGQVQMAFSRTFCGDTFLHDVDVLIARNPAHLPSDMHKVRAVLKPELRLYKDVIVFSVRGRVSLAEKLSGGDFDGDRAWICWEPELVDTFVNTEQPPAPHYDHFGMKKNSETVAEYIHRSDFTEILLWKGLEFSMQPSLLGICTGFHESFCYSINSISDSRAIRLAYLLGLLVDSAKAGLTFTEEMWKSYCAERELLGPYQQPAYKPGSDSRPKAHILDELVLEVGRKIRQKALIRFENLGKDVPRYDPDLTSIWNLEVERAQTDAALRAVLDDLTTQLQNLRNDWDRSAAANTHHIAPGSLEAGTPFKRSCSMARARFLAIQPLPNSEYHLAESWRHDIGSTAGAWVRLKASAVCKLNRDGSFMWYVAGHELGEIKARARGRVHIVADEVWLCMKTSARMVTGLTVEEVAPAWVLGKDMFDHGDDYGDVRDLEEMADLDGI